MNIYTQDHIWFVLTLTRFLAYPVNTHNMKSIFTYDHTVPKSRDVFYIVIGYFIILILKYERKTYFFQLNKVNSICYFVFIYVLLYQNKTSIKKP